MLICRGNSRSIHHSHLQLASSPEVFNFSISKKFQYGLICLHVYSCTCLSCPNTTKKTSYSFLLTIAFLMPLFHVGHICGVHLCSSSRVMVGILATSLVWSSRPAVHFKPMFVGRFTIVPSLFLLKFSKQKSSVCLFSNVL